MFLPLSGALAKRQAWTTKSKAGSVLFPSVGHSQKIVPILRPPHPRHLLPLCVLLQLGGRSATTVCDSRATVKCEVLVCTECAAFPQRQLAQPARSFSSSQHRSSIISPVGGRKKIKNSTTCQLNLVRMPRFGRGLFISGREETTSLLVCSGSQQPTPRLVWLLPRNSESLAAQLNLGGGRHALRTLQRTLLPSVVYAHSFSETFFPAVTRSKVL